MGESKSILLFFAVGVGGGDRTLEGVEVVGVGDESRLSILASSLCKEAWSANRARSSCLVRSRRASIPTVEGLLNLATSDPS